MAETLYGWFPMCSSGDFLKVHRARGNRRRAGLFAKLVDLEHALADEGGESEPGKDTNPTAAGCETDKGSEGAARIRPKLLPEPVHLHFALVGTIQKEANAERKEKCELLREGWHIATDNSDHLLGTWKWKKVSGHDHQPRWIMSASKIARRKQAAAIWRAPPISSFMPTGGRNVWRGARVTSGTQALYLKPRTINRHYLLHPSSTKAPAYPGADYLWTPKSLLTEAGRCDVGDLWSKQGSDCNLNETCDTTFY
jgi:hypothetical protein